MISLLPRFAGCSEPALGGAGRRSRQRTMRNPRAPAPPAFRALDRLHAVFLRLGIALCVVLQAFPVALFPASSAPAAVSTDERFESEIEAPESASEAALATSSVRSATGRRAGSRPPPGGAEPALRVAGRRAASATPFSERRPPPYFPRPRKVLLRRLS